MKQLFHIAIESNQYSSQGITKAFQDCGYTVTQFNWQGYKFNYGREAMHEECITIAKRIQPDVIFVHAQNKEAFDKIIFKKLNDIAFTINYTYDVRDDIGWYKQIAPYIGLTLFACKEDVESCKRSGINNVSYMPSSADFDVYTEKKFFKSIIHCPHIVFIGNNTVNTNLNYPRARQRQDMIEFLDKHYGDNFMAFGLGQKGGMITDVKHEVEIYNKCKIAITHNNYFKTGYCSDRDWRATGCGALTIHQYFDGVHDLFGHSAVVWSGFDDLKFMCDYFLNDEMERIILAQTNRQFAINNNTWAHRFRSISGLIPKPEKI